MPAVRRGGALTAMCLALAVGGGGLGCSSSSSLKSSPTPAASGTALLHVTSTISPQAILDLIHDADDHLLSGDHWQPGHRLHPTRGFLGLEFAGFQTDCSNRFAFTYAHYKIGTTGLKVHKPCGAGPGTPITTHVGRKEFRPDVRRIARIIEQAVGVTTTNHPILIDGTRDGVLLQFSYNGGLPNEIAQISVYPGGRATINKTV